VLTARQAARIRQSLRLCATIGFFAALGAIVFVLAAALNLAFDLPLRVDAWLQVTSLFAVLGATYGVVVALDRSADFPPRFRRIVRPVTAPVLRTAICAALGIGAVALVRSWLQPPFADPWLLVGAVAGGVFGWYGWRFAKYVDF
jgi:hypothetical protein